MYGVDFGNVIGKRVQGVSISDDQEMLIFHLPQTHVVYMVEGDCCSYSWFADITGLEALVGEVVNEMDWVEMDWYNVDDGRQKQEEDQAYGFETKTERGVTTFVFRNSSNGYYGGWMNETNMPGPSSERKFKYLMSPVWRGK